jgi:hypothetical protein
MIKKTIFGTLIVMLLIFQAVSVLLTQADEINSTVESLISTDDIITMINQVDVNKIRQYLEDFVSFGYKKTGTKNCKLTAEYIFEKFQEFDLYTYYDNWWYPRYKFRPRVLLIDRNVVAVHNGSDTNSDAVIIVCAHYDTLDASPGLIKKGCPGANDDGSGIVAMLSIAEIVSQYNFNHTIRFIAFSGEEEGCYGSYYDAKQAYKRDENIIAVLNIDTIGYVNNSKDGKILQVFCQERSNWIVDYSNEIDDKYHNHIDIKTQYTFQYPADHDSFNDFGYDSAQFIQPKPELYHWMHTPEDTIDKINFSYLTKVTKLILALTAELSNKHIDVQIRIINPYESRIYLFSFPILKTPGFNLVRSKTRGLTYLIGKCKATVNITTDEEINSVYFGIDGYWTKICSKPPYEWKIGKRMYPLPLPFKLKGFHRLNVCVTTNEGNIAYDEMDIFIVKLL